MKIDRLLGIITYLLNRDIVTCKQLASKFEVTERTIQRDIESINMAGIPIVSLRGTNGGYKILDHFRFSKQTISRSDLSTIRLALESLSSVLLVKDGSELAEKVGSIHRTEKDNKISIDFGVASENPRVVDNFKLMSEAIQNNRLVEFTYTSSSNYTSQKVLEPVALKFKWYAWYIVCYIPEKDEYRIYKMSRISNLRVSPTETAHEHKDIDTIFDRLMNKDSRIPTKVEIRVPLSIFVSFNEYFHKLKILSKDHEYAIISIDVFENERMWFAFLLSFCDEIEIIEPQHIKSKIYNHSKKILEKFEIPDK